MRPLKRHAEALCCECGALRWYRMARGMVGEWLDLDRGVGRHVGDLKCFHCATITKHALLRLDDDRYRDEAEHVTDLATGRRPPDPFNDPCPDRLARVWALGLEAGRQQLEEIESRYTP